jgi:hypothetical protein
LNSIDLTDANLHAMKGDSRSWVSVDLAKAKSTDPGRLHGETWMPPA